MIPRHALMGDDWDHRAILSPSRATTPLRRALGLSNKLPPSDGGTGMLWRPVSPPVALAAASADAGGHRSAVGDWYGDWEYRVLFPENGGQTGVGDKLG